MVFLLMSFTMPSFVMHELCSPLAVVCHDAGAANLIIAWVKAWGGETRPFMQGPAAVLWANAFPDRPLLPSLDSAVCDAAMLLSGTGWASSLEHLARVRAKESGIPNIAVLDHWVNYAPRFEWDGHVQWPDQIWVADEYAFKIACNTFPELPVRQLENLYLAEQVANIRPPPRRDQVLYVLEPIRNAWGRDRDGEFQALDYAIEHFKCLVSGTSPTLILRLHPSEPVGKYHSYLEKYAFIRMDESMDVAAAISQADVVVGVESFALTIALAAGRPVFSSLPPWAPTLRLPHKGIQQIRNLSSL